MFVFSNKTKNKRRYFTSEGTLGKYGVLYIFMVKKKPKKQKQTKKTLPFLTIIDALLSKILLICIFQL